MALNYPGPFQLRFFYSVTVGTVALTHKHQVNLDLVTDPGPGEEFDQYEAATNGAFPVQLDTGVDAYVTLLRAFWSGGCTIQYAELWKYTPDTFDASFHSVYDISLAGTSVVSNLAAAELIGVFRTSEGGVMKLTFEDVFEPQGNVIKAPYTGKGYLLDMANWVTSSDGFLLGRDTSKIFADVGFYPGQNEKIFKKRFRAT